MQYVNPKGTVEDVTLEDLLSDASYTVLYFYPKDNTPDCTLEARDFTKLVPQFKKAGAQVIGVSKNKARSHCNFQNLRGLKLGLISDPEGRLAQDFDAWGEKKFMGRPYMGMFRNTYLLDNKGSILYKRENISVPGHAKEVLEYIKSL